MPMPRLVVDVDENFHQAVRIKATEERIRVSDLLRALLQAWLEGQIKVRAEVKTEVRTEVKTEVIVGEE
jgi:hypothetical protein